jgi:hypothetical protein
MNSIKINYIIQDNYKDLINKDIYETVVLKIMNKSNIVFPEKYKHIDEQSNGESDFISINSGELIDAKTIFPKKQCESLSFGNLNDFYEMIITETNDVFEALMNKKDDLNSTMLYKEIINAFCKIKPKERRNELYPTLLYKSYKVCFDVLSLMFIQVRHDFSF